MQPGDLSGGNNTYGTQKKARQRDSGEIKMSIWRELSPEEEKEFRQAARKNYKPFSDLDPLWHPVYTDECVKINVEHGVKVPEEMNR